MQQIPKGDFTIVSPRPGVSEAKGEKINLMGLDRSELADLLHQIGVPDKQVKMRTSQIWNWLYLRGITDFNMMTNVSKPTRDLLARHFTCSRPEITEAQYSNDGTRKYLLRFADGSEAETVYIPEEDRGTLCISSQVGCTLNCKFCHTGTMRLVRNLTASEIVAQIMVARDDLDEWADLTAARKVTNVVLMGMGEPLYNFDAVKKALEIIMDPEGIQLSRRRITLSTSGVVPQMERCGQEMGVNLAVSLHAVRDDVRTEIMPINKKYNLDAVLTACANYPGSNNARRITFEYTMLQGINDSLEDAKELVRLMRRYKLPAKINLIPFNPWPGSDYQCSDRETIKRFSDFIFDAGISAPIRTPRGRDIQAACGQLKSASEKKSAASLKREQKAAALYSSTGLT